MATDILRSLAHVLRRLLHVLARPMKGQQRHAGRTIQPYRGYGTHDEVFLMGRVFEQSDLGTDLAPGTLLRDIADVLRRFLRWGVAGAMVTARLGRATTYVATDADGYFRLRLQPGDLPDTEDGWHTVALDVEAPDRDRAQASAQVFVPPRQARYVVVSDIDDTVVFTGVASFFGMLWRLFAQDAESRVAFPGVGELYRALHAGASGHEQNPMLYVSRGPWSIYDVLEEFFQMHHIPIGPVLFLRDWGLTPQHPLPRRSRGHKRELIETMLALYEDRPFILIGDSGQHDPETYVRVVRDHPNRVAAVYIRNVTDSAERRAAIEHLAEEVADAGSHLFLAADSYAMAEHMAEHGFIAPEVVADVLRERIDQKGEADLQPRRDADPHTVDDVLQQDTGDEKPPNIAIDTD